MASLTLSKEWGWLVASMGEMLRSRRYRKNVGERDDDGRVERLPQRGSSGLKLTCAYWGQLSKLSCSIVKTLFDTESISPQTKQSRGGEGSDQADLDHRLRSK